QVCSLFPVSCTSANVTISVTGTPPVANPDVTTTGVNTPVAICVLCNDMGGPLDPASVIIVSSTVPGTLSVNTTTGEITFSPNSTFVGTTQFTYQVCSLFPISCVSNIVSITVTGNAPIANPDVTTTGKNTPTDICVLCNDTGGPLNPASVTVSGVTTVPGTFAVNTTTGIITFTPNATFVGITTFTYQVCTYFPISCTSANVTVSVTGAPPIANPDVTSTGINTPVNICVLCNDAGGPLNPSSVSVPVSTVPGTLTVNSTTGAITFTPNATFSGITTFNYQVCSLFLVSCTSTNVTISVTGNVPPVLKPDTNNTPFNGPITICGLQNDMDVDGSLDNSSVQVFAITPIEAGTISIIGTSGCFVFTPNGTFTGPVNYKYRVCDNGSPQACATTTGVISVTGNVPPILKPENTTTGQNIPLTICGLDNDFDIGGTLDASSVQILNISPSGSGTITVLPGSGCILFTPNSTFIGIVTYIYKVCDLQTPVACTTITSTITVTGTVPTTPTANPDTTTTGVNQPITVCVLCNDTGGPLDPSSVKTVGSVVGANVTIDPLTGLLTVNPNVGYFGVINFTYEVCTYAPTTCVSAMVSITVTGTGTVTGAPRANLGITVSGVGTIEIDKFITYTVTSFNFGPDTAKNVTLSLFLSKEISNVSVSNGGTYDQVTGIVQWNVTSFASGTSNAYTVLFIPKNDPILITASGIISSSTIDPDTLNNKSFASTLLIYPSEQEGLYIADGFSPDGDGINETLIIDSKGKEYTLKVFNRWGNLVYENGDYKNDWDGKPNRGLVAGEKLPSGTYFLILEFADGSKKEVKSITIMR
ncbi:MAG: Ig-like domain-containing protein, partial [Bacteroidota bacterium]|nr:Ig-like domain-containing protein [Bacteroidota bacterium]